MPRTYTITYDTVTPESAEYGDYADTGFGDPRTFGSTSVREGACIDPDLDVRQAALAEASAAATSAIEPDGYDIEEHGDESSAAVALMVRVLRDAGGEDGGDGTSWYCDWSQDYLTGEETRLAYHLSGWGDGEIEAIRTAMRRRQ